MYLAELICRWYFSELTTQKFALVKYKMIKSYIQANAPVTIIYENISENMVKPAQSLISTFQRYYREFHIQDGYTDNMDNR